MKPFPWKCRTCRKDAVQRVTAPYQTDVEHDGKIYPVTIPDLSILRCEECAAIVLDDEANRRITEAFRAKAGLLTPEQIRQGRLSLGLTQKQLADKLKIADATLSRWETGGQVQQQAMDRLLRVYFGVPETRRYLDHLAGATALNYKSALLALPILAHAALTSRVLRRLQPWYFPTAFSGISAVSASELLSIDHLETSHGLELQDGEIVLKTLNDVLCDADSATLGEHESGEEWAREIDEDRAHALRSAGETLPSLIDRMFVFACCDLWEAVVPETASLPRGKGGHTEASGSEQAPKRPSINTIHRAASQVSRVVEAKQRLCSSFDTGIDLLERLTVLDDVEKEEFVQRVLFDLKFLTKSSLGSFPALGEQINPLEDGPLGRLWGTSEPGWYRERKHCLDQELARINSIVDRALPEEDKEDLEGESFE